MRKNTQKVLDALIAGTALPQCPAIWTDGRCAYSYQECIAAPDPENPGGYVVTNKRWSQTTTIQTNGISFGLSHKYKKSVREVDQVEVDSAMLEARR
jgi:hypothetical protein